MEAIALFFNPVLNAPASLLIAGGLGIFLMGLSKGGFASPLAIMSVPVMTLAMPPLQATAIMLPLLLVMDVVAVKAYWQHKDWRALRIMIPAGIIGVGIGWALASVVTNGMIRLLIGLNAVIYVLIYWFTDIRNRSPRAHRDSEAGFWGALGGFTSFISHAGALPIQMYLLPRKLTPVMMVAISTKFIAVINLVKVIPYFALGQFSPTNLSISLVLFPIGPIAVFIGLWLVKQLSPEKFYKILYFCLFAVGAKLCFDGVSELFWV